MTMRKARGGRRSPKGVHAASLLPLLLLLLLLLLLGRIGLADERVFLFNPATQMGMGLDPGAIQAVSAASGVWREDGCLQGFFRSKLTRDQVQHDSGLIHVISVRVVKVDTVAKYHLLQTAMKGKKRKVAGRSKQPKPKQPRPKPKGKADNLGWVGPVSPQGKALKERLEERANSRIQFVKCYVKGFIRWAPPAAIQRHVAVTLTTWDAVWGEYMHPKWAEQKMRLHGAHEKVLERYFKKLYGMGFNTANATSNYNWPSINLTSSADFSFMLLGDSPDSRFITVDTGLTEGGQCAPSGSRWDTELVVFAHVPDVCGASSAVLPEALVASNDDDSVCGGYSSRVSFTAAPGQDYLIVVKGYDMTEAGPPTIVIGTTDQGRCQDPVAITGLVPGQSLSVGAGTSTCDIETPSWDTSGNPDFTYRLLGDVDMERVVWLDTCVEGQLPWDTEIRVFTDEPDICSDLELQEQASAPLALVRYDDDSSPCGRGRSYVSFKAAPGVSYLIVVSGFPEDYNCGSAALTVTASAVDAGEGTCSNPYEIAGLPAGATNRLYGMGFNTANATSNYNWPSINLTSSADFSFMLLGDSPDSRFITVDTGLTEGGQCAPSGSRWDTELVVFAHVPDVCGASSAVLPEALVASNDDDSVCGGYSSRVSFTAAPGQDYLIVVKGYDMTEAGPPTIVIGTTDQGRCQDPVAITGLVPGQSLSVGAGTSTCDIETPSWDTSGNPDFTYRLLGDVDMERVVWLDTCVEGQLPWDTEIRVFTDEPDICSDLELQEQASAPLALVRYDDDSSPCGRGRSYVSFKAAPGVSYLIVVSGFPEDYNCGSAALTVTASAVDAGEGTCSNPYEIAGLPAGATNRLYGMGFNTANATSNYNWPSINLTSSADFSFMLLGDSPESRFITVDTGLIEGGQCAPSGSRWDTELVVFAHVPDVCGASSAVLPEALVASNDDDSVCGGYSSRVSFTAAPGQDYLIVVKGYDMTEAGPPTIVISTTGLCQEPVAISGLVPGQILSVGAGISTCNIEDPSWSTSSNPDFTYRLLGDVDMERVVWLDTCVEGQLPWDTEIRVFTDEPDICSDPELQGQASVLLALVWYDNDISSCRGLESYVSFTAAPGVSYFIVVSGFAGGDYNCGSAALTVTAFSPETSSGEESSGEESSREESSVASAVAACGSAALTVTASAVDAGEGTCSNPYEIAGLPAGATNRLYGMGFNTANATSNYNWPSINLTSSADFSFMLLGDSPESRFITVDTGLTEGGQCAPSGSRWDTELVVFAHVPDVCGASSAVLPEALVASNDDDSVCGGYSSRVSFTAAPGQDYLIVVKGYDMTEAGPPTIVISTTGLCQEPVAISGLVPGQILSVGAGISTCNIEDPSWSTSSNPDFTYRLLGDVDMERVVWLDTCVEGQLPWDTEIRVFTDEPDICSDPELQGQASVLLALVWYDNDISSCRGLESYVSFTAAPGVSYFIVVSGFAGGDYNCGSAALTVTAFSPETSSGEESSGEESSREESSVASAVAACGSAALTVTASAVDAGEGTCSNPYEIAGLPAGATNRLYGMGFNTANATSNYNWPSINLTSSADFSFMLLGDSPESRFITVDTGLTEGGQCAPSGSRWDTELVVFAHVPDVCGASSAVLPEALVASNDDDSVCGGYSSRVSFTAAPGQDYLIVVKGYDMTEAGPPTIVISTTGLCQEPVAISGLVPGQILSVGAGISTCNIEDPSWSTSSNPDFTYRLLGDVDMERVVWLDTCVEGQLPWDTEIRVFTDEPDICSDPELQGQASVLLALVWYDNDISSCRGLESYVSFTAAPGVSYFIVVSGFAGGDYNCGSAALTVTAFSPETSSGEESSGEESSREESSVASAVAAVRSRKLLPGA
ncbi:hypothetical protein QJQ45_008513 [Haematococcus lacustris]|nr:hypothetical protein QJQ45_008513 [Haematococcus lacustris]